MQELRGNLRIRFLSVCLQQQQKLNCRDETEAYATVRIVSVVYYTQNEPSNATNVFDTTRKGNHSSLLIPTVGDAVFRLKFALKVTHPLRKTPTSTYFRLWRPKRKR